MKAKTPSQYANEFCTSLNAKFSLGNSLEGYLAGNVLGLLEEQAAEIRAECQAQPVTDEEFQTKLRYVLDRINVGTVSVQWAMNEIGFLLRDRQPPPCACAEAYNAWQTAQAKVDDAHRALKSARYNLSCSESAMDARTKSFNDAAKERDAALAAWKAVHANPAS